MLEEGEDRLHHQPGVAAEQFEDGLRGQEAGALLGAGKKGRLHQRVEAVVVQAHERAVVDDLGERGHARDHWTCREALLEGEGGVDLLEDGDERLEPRVKHAQRIGVHHTVLSSKSPRIRTL